MQLQPSATKSGKRIARIDGIRAVAILGVIVVHTHNFFPAPYQSMALGRFGPQMFFLISGYILSEIAHSRKSPATEFFLRRFFRLAPAYYLALTICFLLGINENLEEPIVRRPLSPVNLALHLSFLHGLFPDYIRSVLGVMWSLTPEVIFYLIFPLLAWLPNWALWGAFVVALALAKVSGVIAAWFFAPLTPAVHVWVVLSPMANMYLFVFGMLVFAHRSFFSHWIWIVVGMLSLSGFALSDSDFLWVKSINRLAYGIFTSYHFGWLLLAFPYLVLGRGWILRQILDNPVCSVLGRISYSAFFIHYFVLLALTRVGFQSNFFTAISIVILLTVAIAYASFRYLEQPGIKLGNVLIARHR